MAPFPLFDLPPELRLLIWRAACEPRRVSLAFRWNDLISPPRVRDDGVHLVVESAPTPVMLHVSRKTREATLPIYRHVHIRAVVGRVTHGNFDRAKDDPPPMLDFYYCSNLDIVSLQRQGGSALYDPYLKRLLAQLQPQHLQLARSIMLWHHFSTVFSEHRPKKTPHPRTFDLDTIRLGLPAPGEPVPNEPEAGSTPHPRTVDWDMSIATVGPRQSLRFIYRLVRTNMDLQRTAVAHPPVASYPLAPGAGQPSEPNYATRLLATKKRWTFSPLKEHLQRDGVILFDDGAPRNKSKLESDYLVLLVIDPTDFPEELMWGLAARSRMHWNGDARLSRERLGRPNPVYCWPEVWGEDALRHFDGICVPGYGFSNGYPQTSASKDWQSIYNARTMVAELARRDLRMPIFAQQLHRGDSQPAIARQFADRKAWLDAITFGKDAYDEDSSQNNGVSVGSRSAREIRRVLEGLVSGEYVWEKDESTEPVGFRQPMPDPRVNLSMTQWAWDVLPEDRPRPSDVAT